VDIVELAPTVYHLRSGSNAGLIVQGKEALLVDAGLDRDAARRILKAVDRLGVRLVACIITHAHADHFGGAYGVRRRAEIPVYAPTLEAAIIENPLLEPLYLFSGAAPVAELRGRFIMAKRGCPVDYPVEPGLLSIGDFDVQLLPLPGHAPNQVAVAWGNVCFIADALFPASVIEKYGIPFYVDVDQTLASFDHMADWCYDVYAPGHGDAVTDPKPLLALNRERVLLLRDRTLAALDQPCTAADVLRLVANSLELHIDDPTIYYLTRTTIHACLNSLRTAGLVDLSIRNNQAFWART